MSERRPFIWLRWHWITRLVAVAAFAGMFWINLDLSQENYIQELGNGFKGGIRLGFPFAYWDGGKHAAAILANDQQLLQTKSYGGMNWLAAALDLLFLSLAVAGSGWLTERFVRKVNPAKNTAAARPPVALITGATVLVALALLLWLNMTVTTKLEPTETGITIQYQRMGWPLASYTASEPLLLPAANVVDAGDRVLMQSNPDLWRRLAHWEHRNIVLNIFIAVALAATAGGLVQYLNKKIVDRG